MVIVSAFSSRYIEKKIPRGLYRGLRGSLLRRQANAAGADQAGIGRLEPPEGAARRSLQIDVLVVGAAEGEVGGCRVAVRDRNETENDAAPIALDDTAKPGHCCPQIAAHVVVHAVRAAIAGEKGPGLHGTEGRMRRILWALRATHCRTVLEGAVPDST